MSGRNAFVRGAVILGVAGMFSKLLGSVYTIFLQNLIGDRGLGLYQMAYPIYATLLVLSTAGIPIAVSKFVAERLAIGDNQGAVKVFRVSLALLSATGIFSFVVLYYGADGFARLSGDVEAIYSIRAIAPALLIVPVLSVIRGYFQGWQWMQPTAVSQVVEQLVRVATILAAASILLQWGYSQAAAAAGAAFGAVSGAAAGLVVLLGVMVRRKRLFHLDPGWRGTGLSFPAIVRQVVGYAVPISLGALVVPMMNNVDVLTVVNLLKQGGIPQQQATEMFGLLTGRAFKLVMLPATFANAIGAALMPAVSEAVVREHYRMAWERSRLAVRLTVLIALPSVAGLILLSEPIDITLFKDTQGTEAIRVMALATLFSSIQVTTSAILQGMNRMFLPVRNLLAGAGVKLALNLVLVPVWGIQGAAVSTVASYGVSAWLNVWSLRRETGMKMGRAMWLIRPLLAVFFMSVAVLGIMIKVGPFFYAGLFSYRLAAMLTTVVAITVAVVVYGFSLMVTGGVTAVDVAAVPKIGPSMARFFSRIGVLR